MRKSLSAPLAAAALACAVGTAHAAEDGFYVGAGVTEASVDHIFGYDSHLRIEDTAWKAFLGFKLPVIPLGIEAEYIDLGSDSRNYGYDYDNDYGYSSGHADAKAFAGFVVGYLPLPLPFLDVYAKVGAARWQLDGYTTRPSLFSVDDRGTQFAWGAGVQFHMQQFAVRAEYEGFDIKNTNGARLFTVGASYYFPL